MHNLVRDNFGHRKCGVLDYPDTKTGNVGGGQRPGWSFAVRGGQWIMAKEIGAMFATCVILGLDPSIHLSMFHGTLGSF